jgi:hypothetical protein
LINDFSGSGVTPQLLIDGLPKSSDFNEKIVANSANIQGFIDQVWDARRDVLPYMYGSYEVFKADKSAQQYQFVSHLNTTSQDVTADYPQFMYESILKAATNNQNFKFKVRSTPYVPTTRVQLRKNGEELNAILI